MQAPELQAPQHNNQLYCDLPLCGKLHALCAAQSQAAVSYGMMEKGQISTDYFIKTLVYLAALH